MEKKDETIRINKYLANKGLCSRREADHLVAQGWVLVDGQPVDSAGFKVAPHNKVTFTEQAQSWLGGKKTIILNKPPGLVSGQAEDDHRPAVSLIIPKNFFGDKDPGRVTQKGLAPAGRLDIDSSGLLILTDDGKMAKSIIGEDSHVEKEYIVKVKGAITDKKLDTLCFGLSMDGKELKEAKIKQINETQLNFTLLEGKKRQIRRMCEMVDLEVMTLKRIRIGNVKLGQLPRGMWRFLAKDEYI